MSESISLFKDALENPLVWFWLIEYVRSDRRLYYFAYDANGHVGIKDIRNIFEGFYAFTHNLTCNVIKCPLTLKTAIFR